MDVLATAFDSALGGRDFDEALFDHFVSEFQAKYKIDVRTNTKASLRLRTACTKLKHTLSANPEAVLNVDCLMNDIDVSGRMKRDEFEQLSKDVLDRVCKPVETCLKK